MNTSASTPSWQPPSCSATSIVSMLVMTAINSSFLEQRPAPDKGCYPLLWDEYDFVVVGGGSAGCVVAGRLSEDPRWSVLLLEAGGEQPEVTKVPGVYTYASVSSKLNWGWTSQPQDNGVCPQGCDISRGKGLGGSSAMGGMVYIRGNREDFNRWGVPGWSYEDVLPFFKRAEDNRDPDVANDTRYHATGGPLSVQRMLYQDANIGILSNAMTELGFPTVDLNGEHQIGQSVHQMTVRGAERDSTNTAYLDPIRGDRGNLRVETSAFVTKILFRPGSTHVRGVAYVDGRGIEREVRVRKEVVLSAGTLTSPQLLMLSGVGPADHLRDVGVPVVLDLPGVGENLQEHALANGVTFQLGETATNHNATLQERLGALVDSQQRSQGPFTATGTLQYGALARSSLQAPDDPRPDIQYEFSTASSTSSSSDSVCPPDTPLLQVEPHYYDRLSVRPILLHSPSRGRVRLSGTDPRRQPLVLFNLLQGARDAEVLAEALRNLTHLADTRSFRSHGLRLLPPGGDTAPQECQRYCATSKPDDGDLDDSDDRLWLCLARASSVTAYHAIGTCAMGSVVDARLSVRGARGLRVVDASVMPQDISGNPGAATVMVAERGASFIREDWDTD